MIRIPFEILDIEVDKLYLQPLDETDEEAINERILYIKNFINACGWTEDSYLRKLMGFDNAN